MLRSLVLILLILGLGFGIQQGSIKVDWLSLQADFQALWEQWNQRSQENGDPQ